MEELPKGNYLKFKPNQLQAVRQLYDLEKPGRMDEAVNLLNDWVKKQEHFRKKDFSRVYLEILLITNKGSIERSKERLDNLCTLKTVCPEFFVFSDINHCMKQNKTFELIVLPDIMDDMTRVILFRINNDESITSDFMLDCIKYSNIVGEYLKVHDYMSGFRVLADFSNINIMNFLTIVTPTQLSQIISLYLKGYGIRMKGIHILSQSKMVDSLVSVLKPILGKKVGTRLYVHKTVESVYEYIPKEILPVDYVGDAPTVEVLLEHFLKELSSAEHVEYMKGSNGASTEESRRLRKSTFNDNFVGISGSFRTLCVD